MFLGVKPDVSSLFAGRSHFSSTVGIRDVGWSELPDLVGMLER